MSSRAALWLDHTPALANISCTADCHGLSTATGAGGPQRWNPARPSADAGTGLPIISERAASPCHHATAHSACLSCPRGVERGSRHPGSSRTVSLAVGKAQRVWMQPLLLSGQGKEKALTQFQLLSEEGDREKRKKKKKRKPHTKARSHPTQEITPNPSHK